MEYCNEGLGQYWPRYYFSAWRHQVITWANVNLSSKVFCVIYLCATSQDALMLLIHSMCSDVACLKLTPYFPGSDDNT